MNYKQEIEKIAVQVMPHVNPKGGHFIPRGFIPMGPNDTHDQVNFDIRDSAMEHGMDWQPIPKEYDLVAQRIGGPFLLNKKGGGLAKYDTWHNKLSDLTPDEINAMYSTREVDTEAVRKIREMGPNKYEHLYRHGTPDDYVRSGFKDWGELVDANEQVYFDDENNQFLSQYKQASDYKAEIEKIAGVEWVNDTKNLIPMTGLI